MSIFIEQDPQQVRDAVALNSKAEIASVRLIASQITCSIKRSELSSITDLAFRHAPEAIQFEDESLTVATRFAFKAVSGKRKKRDVMAVDCVFESRYTLMPGYEPTTAEMEAFRTGNAVFNCWPFFREFVQSMVVRMDMPPPPVPFLRLAPKGAAIGEGKSQGRKP
jgi:hypothetical protein